MRWDEGVLKILFNIRVLLVGVASEPNHYHVRKIDPGRNIGHRASGAESSDIAVRLAPLHFYCTAASSVTVCWVLQELQDLDVGPRSTDPFLVHS